MGMELYLFMSKYRPPEGEIHPEEINIVDDEYIHDQWVEIAESTFFSTDCIYELYYTCSFYGLNEVVQRRFWNSPHKNDLIKQLTKEDIRALRDYAANNYDSFGSFIGVPTLCEILAQYDAIEEAGFHLWWECSD